MEIDLPSQNFQPRIYGVGAWTDNLPFAYDLIATTKPQLLVELGTDRGESYFTFCQSVLQNQTSTRCFAVDNWLGDDQAGSYDETTFAEVSAHNSANYGDFSTLMRCTFDEALSRFAPESIDVLHLDGFHTEAAVRHDVETWLSKIRPGGILLMHDVRVRRRDFGVWKIWEELRARSRSFIFTYGTGLGVWQKPPAAKLSEPTETLLTGPSAPSAPLIKYYDDRARQLHELIATQWRDGSIRQTAIAYQTSIQIFHTHDGIHREEDSSFARIGHDEWKDVSIALPAGAGAAPLRVDFYSAYTIIELSSIRVTAGDEEKFSATSPEDFEKIGVAGDAERLPHAANLRIKVLGPDPQLYLLSLSLPNESPIRLSVRLRVVAN